MNKIVFVVLFGLISTLSYAQKIDYNVQGGYIAEGYDVVAYFSQKAVKGKRQYIYNYDGVHYKFSSRENLNTFKANPAKYIPQYGGWCAYAMGEKGEKVAVNPKTFEIRNGKLYLFYNAFFNNTLESWLEEGPERLRKKADANWQRIKWAKR